MLRMRKSDELLNSASKWDLVIRPKGRWLDIDFPSLWRYRDLILMFIKRDFVALYKQTILGPIWYLLQPAISTVMFAIIFGTIARIPTDGVPPYLFYLSGFVCWTYFADCLTITSTTFITNASIFGKVYFPRLAVPISVTLSSMIKFLIQAFLFVSVYAYFWTSNTSIRPHSTLMLLPALVLQMALLGLGVGVLISSLTTRYRDLNLLVSFGVQLWMYATPIVYPVSQIPEHLRPYFQLNPMAAIVSNFRLMTLGSGNFDLQATTISVGMTLVILALGLILFTRTEKTFMDTV